MSGYDVWGITLSGTILYQHRNNVGIKTMGLIDYLVNYHNYQRRLCNDKQWNEIH